MQRDTWNWLDWTAVVLVVVGALNWGLVGLSFFLQANLNVVNQIFVPMFPAGEAIIYLLVGIAGLYLIYSIARSDSQRLR